MLRYIYCKECGSFPTAPPYISSGRFLDRKYVLQKIHIVTVENIDDGSDSGNRGGFGQKLGDGRSDGAMKAMKNNAMAMGAMKNGAMAMNGAMKDQAMAMGAMKNGAMAMNGAMKDKAMAMGAMNGAMKSGAMAMGAMKNRAMAMGAMRNGAMAMAWP